MNKQKVIIWGVVTGAGILLIGILVGIMMQRSAVSYKYIPLGRNDKLSLTMSLLENRYVDSLTSDSLVELVVPTLLEKLDPHSVYITKEEFASANEPLTGHFDGIGVIFNMMTDTVLVSNVISGGPSDKVGVVAGDKIITINDSVVAGRKIKQDDIVKMLRGTKGTIVKLGIERNKAAELIPITVTRGVIPMKSVEASFMIKDDIGYIKFSRFAATTYQEIAIAMLGLKTKGATRLILDLRGNSGGYLDQAIHIVNEFLPEGQMIVYTEGAHAPRIDQLADGKGRYRDIPLTLIIDEGSASASEILAGAIQDNDRGIIVGRRSFGKGLVQEQFPYSDGSAARITISRYYTPLGRSIQKPYTAGDIDSYNQEMVNRVSHSELFNADSIKQNDAEKFTTPAGRVVYGGGGIMPDIFVPVDTSAVSPFYRKLFEKNLIFKYSLAITESNRKKINSIKNIDELNLFFAGRNLYGDFIAYARRNGVEPTSTEIDKDKAIVMAQLKGYIGRNTILEDNAYYYYIYPEDPAILRALETFLVQ